MKKLSFLLIALVAWFTPVVPASAQTDGLDTGQRILVQEILAYLRTLDTLRSDFVQLNPDGSTFTGTFYLDRPGRMRVEYDRAPYLYVANGSFLTYWDAELEQRSDVPLGSTLADFFVREDIGLSNEVTVVDAGRGDGVVYATVVQTEEPAAGQLTIILGDQPRELREWRAVDAQGYQTQVALTGLETGVALDSDLWRAPRPDRSGPD